MESGKSDEALRRSARNLLNAFDHPEPDESGLWLVYDRGVGASFNWYAVGPRLGELRAVLLEREKESAGNG